MNRDEWHFEYTASKLAEAAKAKMETHVAKRKWWEDKKGEVMAKVKESGIEIRDSVAASISSTKGGFGPQIEIDGGMQRDLTECQLKIREHDKLVRDYDAWVQVLSANADSRLKLDHEDYMFFFGA